MKKRWMRVQRSFQFILNSFTFGTSENRLQIHNCCSNVAKSVAKLVLMPFKPTTLNEWMNEWMNTWMNEWMNNLIDEWMNGILSKLD